MNAYSITAPEEIAKKYGGNKKKIQQAATQGLINPTEAVMAGMFIDRMRNAAAQEQAQQPTVAEQVMNPQPQMPPQGMAATPQAQQMAQRPPQMGMPQQMPPQPMPRMAMGGGLDAIPYNEGDYAEGGIVNFSVAGDVYAQAKAQLERQRAATPIKAERDKITAQLNQLEAEYRKSTYQPNMSAGPKTPSLAQADLSTADPMAINMESFDDNNPVQSQRIDPNRFSTGTYQGEETKYMGKGDEVLGNVRRGLGLFTDFVKSKLPSFDFGDSEEFARLKNAQSAVDPAEQARLQRVALAQQTTGEGQNVVPVDTSDPFAMGMESFEDAQRATGQTAPMRSTDLSLAAQQNIIAQLSPEQKARRAGLGELAAPEALAMLGEGKGTGANETFLTPEDIARLRKSQIKPRGLNAVASPMTADDAIAALGERKGTGANETFVQAPTVEEQVQQTQAGSDTLARAAATADAERAQMTGEAPKSDETMAEYIERMRGTLDQPEDGELTKELKAQIANRAKTMEANKKDAAWMAVLETGVGMLAQGGGQTALQALGKAGGPALKNYATSLKDIKKEDLDLLKLGVSMEAADKKTKAAIDQALIGNFGKKEAALISERASLAVAKEQNKKPAAATIELEGRAALIAQELEAAGKPVPPQNVLLGMASRNLQEQKIQASLAATGVRAQGQDIDTRQAALEQTNALLLGVGAEAKRYRQLQQEDAKNNTNNAAKYKDELYNSTLKTLMGVSSSGATGGNYQFSVPGAQSAYNQYAN